MESDFVGFSLYTGVVRYRDLMYLLGTKDSLVQEGVPHARIYTLDRTAWGGWNFDWNIATATVCYAPEEKFLAVGPLGRVLAIGGGQMGEEVPIADGSISPVQRGPLREVRGIAGGRAHAVGTGRQTYRRDAPGIWSCIDKSARRPGEDATDACFESLDGFSEGDIYAVGWDGEIWHYDGTRWEQLSSPTNVALFKVRCAGNGHVYACGQMGTLLEGRGTDWEVIGHSATEAHLRGMEWFGERLYVSSMNEVFELVDGDLLKVDFGRDVPATCNHLSGRDGIMWSIGAKDVMQFDGATWTRVLKI